MNDTSGRIPSGASPRLGIADDGLGRRVPLDLPADLHGDDAEMSDTRRAVGRFGRGDRLGPAADAVEEVLVMVPALGEPDLSGADDLAFQARGLGLELAAVDPDPAVFADPLRAAPDLGGAARQDTGRAR